LEYYVKKGFEFVTYVTRIGGAIMAKRRLKKIDDIRRYLAGLINRTEAGEVEPGLAGKLGYLANSLARVIETSDLEKRIEQLEKEASKGEG